VYCRHEAQLDSGIISSSHYRIYYNFNHFYSTGSEGIAMQTHTHRKRIGVLLFLMLFFISSFSLTHPIFASTVEETNIQWGDNIQQYLPYTYYGTFYETTDYTFAYTNAKIEFTYIEDTTLNNEYTVTEDFNNQESQQPTSSDITMTNGSYSDGNNMQLDDNSYTTFYNNATLGNYPSTESFDYETEEGVYYGTYDFRDEVGLTESDISFSTYHTANGLVLAEYDNHKSVLNISSTGSYNYIINEFEGQVSGIVELWANNPEGNYKTIRLTSGGTVLVYIRLYTDRIWSYYYDGSNTYIETFLDMSLYHHIKIEFDCNTNIQSVWIDGILQFSDKSFYINNEADTINRLHCEIYVSDNWFIIDAIGYSWDTTSHEGLGYEEGWNTNSHDILPFLDEGYDFDLSYGLNSQVKNNLDGHNNVLHLNYHENVDIGSYMFLKKGFTALSSFIMEFWIYMNGTNAYGSNLVLYIGNSTTNIRVWFDYMLNGRISNNNPTGYDTIIDANQQEWYHIKLTLDCSTDKIGYIINGIDYGEYDFKIPTDYLSWYYIGIDHTHYSDYYIDALGFSWDEGYSIGDNIHDNYYLGYENFESYNQTIEGDYYGTYSFRDEQGETGTNIEWITTEEGDDSSYAAEVISEVDGHNDVINFTCAGDSGKYAKWTQDNVDQTADGITVEFWYKYKDLGAGNIMFNFSGISHDMLFYTSTSSVLNEIWIYYGNGAGGTTYTNVGHSADAWYHIKIVFDFTNDLFDFYINGVIRADDKPFVDDITDTGLSSYSVKLFNFGGANSGECYLDAVGHSWDPDYDIGDNINSHGKEIITALEDNGWATTITPHTSIGISGEFNSHKKFLNLTDDSDTNSVSIYNSFSQQTSGAIEFWFKTTDHTKVHYIQIQGISYLHSIYMGLLWTAGDGTQFYYHNGTNWIPMGFLPANNIWYHFKYVFDVNDVWSFYMNDEHKVDGTYRGTPTYLKNIGFQGYSSHEGYSMYIDALSYSWEDDNTYFKGEYNQHCNVESLIDAQIDLAFGNYSKTPLILNISSYHYTQLYSNVSLNLYNWTSSSWLEINNSVHLSESQRTYYLSQYDISGLFSSAGIMRVRYYCWNESSNYMKVDMLNATVYYTTQLEYEHTLELLGTWKYRWKVDIGLGSEYTGDWIYFNVIQQQPNFEGISESRYSTRWVLTTTATTGTLVSMYEDDLTSGYWDLSDASIETIEISGSLDKDTYISSYDPTTNFGTSNDVQVRYRESSYLEYYAYLKWDYSSYSSSYFLDNKSSDSYLYAYVTICSASPRFPRTLIYSVDDFDENAITWNTKIYPNDLLLNYSYSTQFFNWNPIYLGTPSTQYFIQQINGSTGTDDYNLKWRSSNYAGYEPIIYHYFYKNYHNTTGGYTYMQTDTTETLGLLSSAIGTPISLSSGDLMYIDLETTSDNAQLKLYNGGVLQTTLNVLIANVNPDRQEVEVYVPEDITFDQIKITSELDNTEYLKLYDVEVKSWVFTDEAEQENMYVEPFGQNDLILPYVDDWNLKIYEKDILAEEITIPITYDLYTHVFESYLPKTCFVSFYDADNEYLEFYDFKTYIDYTLYGTTFTDQRLTSREFYADEDSSIAFRVYDSFNTSIYSQSRNANTLIDITLSVYELKIKNEKSNPISYSLNKDGSSITKTGSLFESEILTMDIATGNYSFEYLEEGESEYEEFNFTMTGDYYFRVNRSQMCFLSYTNQRGEYLNFHQFKTYWNGTLLYENIFYEDIGINASIEITDHYDISVKNYSFIVSSGDNYIPITLTMYSLKLMNQQENFNHINITRDPNYYESEYSWSEWIAPGEIIKFQLFAGYYKINLTDTEHDTYTYYAYTLSGDDILLITSNNTLAQIIYNIANVNTTIGNQITAVEINLSNQNSDINNTIISIEINLDNVNSTLGNLLTDIELDILNLDSDIGTLFTFTNNSFINLDSAINSSFIYLENNIWSINESISTLVIGVDNNISIMNGTITTMFTEMNNQFIVTQTVMNLSFAFLNQSITQIANNISDNHVILYNLIEQRANEMNNSLINIQTLINLLNSSVANESLTVQTLINVMGNNMTNYYSTINNLLNLIDNNITNNNIQLVSILELIGNNITTNHFVIENLLDVIGNNITSNHIEMLTNLNLINMTIDQNQIELINRLLLINTTINDLFFDLSNQILLVNDTIYTAVLNLSTSVEFGVDVILGNLSLTYEQNEFLTELYKETMFSQLINWTGAGYNYSIMDDRIDVWEFINNYKNDSIQVFLQYNDQIENLTVSAQNTIEQFLPNQEVEYRLWSVANGEYLTEWTPLPENKTVSFGFYETEIPVDPTPIVNNMMIMFWVFIFFVVGYLNLVYWNNKFKQKQEPQRKYIRNKRKGELTYDHREK